jgi:hypothetical protein
MRIRSSTRDIEDYKMPKNANPFGNNHICKVGDGFYPIYFREHLFYIILFLALTNIMSTRLGLFRLLDIILPSYFTTVFLRISKRA